MKTIILMIAMMAFSSFGFSQETRTLFSNDGTNPKTKGGYGAPFIQVPNINSDWGIIIGGKGGVVLNRKFALGGIGYGLVHSSDFLGDDLNGDINASLNLNHGAGGLFVEYIHKSESPIHFSIPVNIMAGRISVNDATSETEIESSGVFIIEPGINLDFNFSKSFTPALNLSYRLAVGSSLENLSNSDVSGVNIGLIFKFGNI